MKEKLDRLMRRMNYYHNFPYEDRMSNRTYLKLLTEADKLAFEIYKKELSFKISCG